MTPRVIPGIIRCPALPVDAHGGGAGVPLVGESMGPVVPTRRSLSEPGKTHLDAKAPWGESSCETSTRRNLRLTSSSWETPV